jgi:hypothetical protein
MVELRTLDGQRERQAGEQQGEHDEGLRGAYP